MNGIVMLLQMIFAFERLVACIDCALVLMFALCIRILVLRDHVTMENDFKFSLKVTQITALLLKSSFLFLKVKFHT